MPLTSKLAAQKKSIISLSLKNANSHSVSAPTITVGINSFQYVDLIAGLAQKNPTKRKTHKKHCKISSLNCFLGFNVFIFKIKVFLVYKTLTDQLRLLSCILNND